MSLAIAVLTPEGYVYGCDGRWTSSLGDPLGNGPPKVEEFTPGVLLWSGGQTTWQHILEDFREPVTKPARWLRALHEFAVATVHQDPRDGNPKNMHGEAMLATLGGLYVLRPHGEIEEHRRGVSTYAAIGCAENYALGMLDAAVLEGRGIGEAQVEAVLNMAARRYPGVGGPMHVKTVRS